MQGTKLVSGSQVDVRDLQLVTLGIRCTLSQLVETGVMHADPHGGNLLKVRGIYSVTILNPHLLFAQSYPPLISSTRALRRPIVKRSTVWRILMTGDIANLPSDAVSPLKTGTNEIDFSR